MPTELRARDGRPPAEGIGLIPSLAVAFHLFCLFPYLAPVPLPTDTQPYALLVSGAVLLLVGLRWWVSAAMRALVRPVAGALFLLPADAGNLPAWRVALAYVSLFAVAAATVLLARSGYGISDRLLTAAVYVWTAVGAAQFLIDRGFLTGVVSQARTTVDRGVTGLATEPSHYATAAAFMLLLLFLRGRARSLAGLLCIVQVVLLAQSAQVAFLLAFAALVYGLVLVRPAMLVLALLAPVAAVLVWAAGLGIEARGVRILELVSLLLDNPALLVLADPSGNQRVAAIFFALAGFLDHGLLPGSRSEAHTSELQSLMRTSYAVCCLKQKKE